ncbi:unnamed protein product [Polarella glacialis]|uniref:BTB domain-containing protein n=1 Tax=Polarella glacialis TaxID=89957 RepID=A0A813LLR8_POLGL|nr:unnamed protein product [Polarella glacialis]
MPETLKRKRSGAQIEFDGHVYATLDGADPDGVLPFTFRVGHDKDYMTLPSGWELAPSTPDIIQQVIAKHNWSTCSLVAADGFAYFTKTGDHIAGKRRELGGCLAKKGVSYRPARKGRNSFRILIRKHSCAVQEGPEKYALELTSALWAEKRFTDCEVICGEQVTPCHRAVLAKASPVFERMLTAPMSEATERQLRISGVEPETLQFMLQFAYTGELSTEVTDFAELLCLGDCYEMAGLVTNCAEQALERLTTENVAAVVRAFRSCQEKPAMEGMWARLTELLNSKAELLSAVLLTL